MKHDTHSKQLRAVLLAAIMVMSMVGGSIALAGSAAASDHNVVADDGDNGQASVLYEKFANQLPEGTQSETDVLRIKKANQNESDFPSDGFATQVLLESEDVVFDQNQTADNFTAYAVFRDSNNREDTEKVEVKVSDFSERELVIQDEAANPTETGTLPIDQTTYDEFFAIQLEDLAFNAGPEEKATLKWRPTFTPDEAEHDIDVISFDAEINATDQDNGKESNVTAGAQNQVPVTQNNNDATLALEARPSEFPNAFDISLELEEGGIEFNDDISNTVASTSGSDGTATITSSSPTEVEISVTNYQDDSESDRNVVEVVDLPFKVPADAESENITWRVDVQGATATSEYGIKPERLRVQELAVEPFPRGLDRQPDSERDSNGLELSIQNKNAVTNGLQGEDETVTISIPSGNGLEFDQTANVNPSTGAADGVDIAPKQITFQAGSSVNDNTYLNVTNIRFNTTAADEREISSAEIVSDLDIEYTPANPTTRLSLDTEAVEGQIEVKTPEISVQEDGESPQAPGGKVARFAPGESIDGGTHGRSDEGVDGIQITLNDTVGEQIGADTEVIISLEGDSNIEFNKSQEDNLFVEAPEQMTNLPANVDGDQISFEIASFSENSEQGDTLRLLNQVEDGILFDIDNPEDGDSARLAVTTNAGDETVTQLTDTVVSVEDGRVDLSKEMIAASGEDVTVGISGEAGKPLNGNTLEIASSNIEDVNRTVSNVDNGDSITLTPENSENGTITVKAFNNGSKVASDTLKLVAPDIEANPASVSASSDTTGVVSVNAFDTSSRSFRPAGDVNIVKSTDNIPLSRVSVDDSTSEDGEANYGINLNGSEVEDGNVTFTVDDSNLIEVSTTVDASDLQASLSSERISAGVSETVEVELTSFDGSSVSGADVTASGAPLENEVAAAELGNGVYGFDLTAQSPGEITITADTGEETTEKTLSVVGDVSIAPSTIAADNTEDTVEVNVTGVDNEALANINVEAEVSKGDPFNGETGVVRQDSTSSDGTVSFDFDPEFGGEVEISAIGVTKTLEIDGAVIDAAPTELDVNSPEDVTITLEDQDGNALDAESVTATGPPLSSDLEASDDGNGEYSFNSVNATQPGTITITADNVSLDESTVDLTATVDAVADIGTNVSQISAGEESTVTVSLTGTTDDAYAGETIEAGGTNDTIDGTGEAELKLSPDQVGDITVEAVGIGASTAVEAVATVSTDTDEIEEGEETDVTVTVTGANDGIAGAEVTATGDALDSDTTATTDNSGAATLSLTPASGGTISIETGLGTAAETIEVDADSGLGDSGGGGGGLGGGGGGATTAPSDDSSDPEPNTDALPDEAVEADAEPVEDAAPTEPGVTVEFEDTRVEAITFQDSAEEPATVADLVELPDDIEEPEGDVISAVEIQVPEEVEDDSAVVEFAVLEANVDDPGNVRIKHNRDGEWVTLETTLVEESGGELVYEAQTEGFSPFAVTEQQDDEPTETPDQTATPENTDTPTDTPDGEEASIGSFALILVAVVALAALLIAVAGARVYQQDDPLSDDGFM